MILAVLRAKRSRPRPIETAIRFHGLTRGPAATAIPGPGANPAHAPLSCDMTGPNLLLKMSRSRKPGSPSFRPDDFLRMPSLARNLPI